jgi:hypothetical protein
VKRLLHIGLLLMTTWLFSCVKEDDPKTNPPISSIPKITLEKASPDNIKQFGSILFEIAYIDGDGDIGTKDADVKSLEISDNRAGILHSYHVQPQSPASGISISGVLVVELENVILLDQANSSETVTYDIRLKDALGNWSNVVTTQEITISK